METCRFIQLRNFSSLVQSFLCLTPSTEKFANAEDAFAALDDDGGGELSRVELARGLRSVTNENLINIVIFAVNKVDRHGDNMNAGWYLDDTQ